MLNNHTDTEDAAVHNDHSIAIKCFSGDLYSVARVVRFFSIRRFVFLSGTRLNLRLYCCGVLVIASLLGLSSLHAANLPNYETVVDLTVREQEVTEFIEALFTEIEVPVIVSDEIEGTVNGRFNNTAEQVFKEISSAFNTIAYFDGAVAHVYKSNQILRQVISANKSDAVRAVGMVEKMALPDSRNVVEAADGGLLVTGTIRFVDQVREVLTSVSEDSLPSRAEPVVVPITEPEVVATQAVVYRVFKLDHAWADDTNFSVGGQNVVVPGVATILRNLTTTAPAALGFAGRAVTNPPRTLKGLRGQGLLKSESQNSNSDDDASIVNLRIDGDDSRIVVDTRLNAVVIRDVESSMAAYASLIEKLDAPSGMVEIEATIIDVNTDKSRELGINWRYQNDGEVSGSFGSDALSGRGGILSVVLGEQADFLARINLLEEQGAARIVSKPHVITLSDVEAVLGATTEFFVRVAGDQQVDLFNVPVGTILRVTPHIFSESGIDKVKLLVNIEDGSQSPTASVDLIPVIERATISTQAIVNDGDSLLIGGLVRDAYRKSDYKVPLLGNIPLLGRLFRSDLDSTTRVERLFMITPRLADGIGFTSTDRLPVLQGGINNILSESSQRLDGVSWPPEKYQDYWDPGMPIVEVDTMPSGESDVAITKEAGRRPISRFTVEPWPMGQGQ